MVNLGVVLNEANCRRFEGEKKEHGKIQRELDAANERFKEYERKDVKLREDIKHLQAKQKKLADKRTKDSAKAQACILATAVTLNSCICPLVLPSPGMWHSHCTDTEYKAIQCPMSSNPRPMQQVSLLNIFLHGKGPPRHQHLAIKSLMNLIPARGNGFLCCIELQTSKLS